MHLFYTPDINSKTYTLNKDESRHCTKVLRLTKGDMIEMVDGKGRYYKAIIQQASPVSCLVEVIEKKTNHQKSPYHLHVAIAPVKQMNRFEWFVEKATEIGIHEITPIICANSERKDAKKSRIEKILIAAIKQSGRAYLPKLNDIEEFNKFINRPFPEQKFIAHCYKNDLFPLNNLYTPGTNALIMIGPEGDFSLQEIEEARKKGFQEVRLGNYRMRTETAGVVACNTIQISNLV